MRSSTWRSGAASGALSETKCQYSAAMAEMAGAVFWRGWESFLRRKSDRALRPRSVRKSGISEKRWRVAKTDYTPATLPRRADTLVTKSAGLGSPAGVAWGG